MLESVRQELDTLLAGAIDLHVHCAPDVVYRVVDDLTLLQRFSKRGLAGFVLKSHYFSTTERASTANLARIGTARAYGSLCLNSFVGGLNPYAVELALQSGAVLIWLPTVDAANERHLMRSGDGSTGIPPYIEFGLALARRGLLSPGLGVLDGDGNLLPAAREVIHLIADRGGVLATGHIGAMEVFAVAKECATCGARFLVTHPESPTIALHVDEQVELCRMGGVIERAVAYCRDNDVWEAVAEGIRRTGQAQNILSSDFGGKMLGFPDDGLAKGAYFLRQHGIHDRVITTMASTVPVDIVSR